MKNFIWRDISVHSNDKPKSWADIENSKSDTDSFYVVSADAQGVAAWRTHRIRRTHVLTLRTSRSSAHPVTTLQIQVWFRGLVFMEMRKSAQTVLIVAIKVCNVHRHGDGGTQGGFSKGLAKQAAAFQKSKRGLLATRNDLMDWSQLLRNDQMASEQERQWPVLEWQTCGTDEVPGSLFI